MVLGDHFRVKFKFRARFKGFYKGIRVFFRVRVRAPFTELKVDLQCLRVQVRISPKKAYFNLYIHTSKLQLGACRLIIDH